MRYQLTQPWPVANGVTVPTGTVLDFSAPDAWTDAARFKTIPLTVQALDDEAWQALLMAYPDFKHLFGPSPPTATK
jgi:hypothetical protein